MRYFKQARKYVAGAATAVVGSAAMAAAPDFSGMTSQIDWTTAITAILLVAGGLAGVYVIMTGSSLINGKIKAGK